jgi:plastocyanin
MRRTLPILACALLALAVLAAPVGAAGKNVTIKGNYYDGYHFKPKTVNIVKGKTVHWAWSSDAKHNVTFEKLGGKHSKTKKTIDDFHVTFNKTGTFKYECTVHDFTGKVVVAAG